MLWIKNEETTNSSIKSLTKGSSDSTLLGMLCVYVSNTVISFGIKVRGFISFIFCSARRRWREKEYNYVNLIHYYIIYTVYIYMYIYMFVYIHIYRIIIINYNLHPSILDVFSKTESSFFFPLAEKRRNWFWKKDDSRSSTGKLQPRGHKWPVELLNPARRTWRNDINSRKIPCKIAAFHPFCPVVQSFQ